ncbi:hypothetical protein CN918_29635 [Priestia megaterium]|nr:hypothetical protein CN918_29635 [Priestia megaterium]
MKKIWIPVIFVLVCFTLGFSYSLYNAKAYVSDSPIYHFPVPKNAVVIKKGKDFVTYKWSRASEENGIPYGYRTALKKKGWLEGEREGASVGYSKGKHEVELISTTKQLDIVKTK